MARDTTLGAVVDAGAYTAAGCSATLWGEGDETWGWSGAALIRAVAADASVRSGRSAGSGDAGLLCGFGAFFATAPAAATAAEGAPGAADVDEELAVTSAGAAASTARRLAAGASVIGFACAAVTTTMAGAGLVGGAAGAPFAASSERLLVDAVGAGTA